MGYIAILDFQSGSVTIQKYDNDDPRDADQIVEDIIGQTDNCHYMCMDELNLSINIE